MSKVRINEDKCMETSIIDIVPKIETRAFCTNEITEWFTNKLKVSGHIFLELFYQEKFNTAEEILKSNGHFRVSSVYKYQKEMDVTVRMYPIKTSFLPPTAIVDNVQTHDLFSLLVLENKDSDYGTIVGICTTQFDKQNLIAPKEFIEEKELLYFGETGVLNEANRLFKGHSIKLKPSKIGGKFVNPCKHLERNVIAHPDVDPLYCSEGYVKHIKDTYGLIEFSPDFSNLGDELLY